MHRHHARAAAAAALCAPLAAAPLRGQPTAYARQTVTGITVAPGIAGNFQLLSTAPTTSTFADLGSVPGFDSRTDRFDPPPSCQGAGCAAVADNVFVVSPPHLTKSDVLLQRNLRDAQGDALANIFPPDDASAIGGIDLGAEVRLAQADRLFFTFTDAPFLAAGLAPIATVGSTASAEIKFSISIFDLVGPVLMPFAWSPDGAAGNIVGGVETADPASLNKALTQNGPGAQPTYDPGARNYAANTNLLAAGDYHIEIFMRMSVKADYDFAVIVPEPATLALVGTGLAGAGLARRGRR